MLLSLIPRRGCLLSRISFSNVLNDYEFPCYQPGGKAAWYSLCMCQKDSFSPLQLPVQSLTKYTVLTFAKPSYGGPTYLYLNITGFVKFSSFRTSLFV